MIVRFHVETCQSSAEPDLLIINRTLIREVMQLNGYQPFEPYVQLYVVESDGRCSLAETVDVPYATMMHDVAITENYVIFLLCPILIDGSGLIDGSRTFQESISWQPERASPDAIPF